jgi:hypothetical protein
MVKYYLWIGLVRFELSRPLTIWERVQVFFTLHYNYEIVRG